MSWWWAPAMRRCRRDFSQRKRRQGADARGGAVRGARRQLALHRRRVPLRVPWARRSRPRCCRRWRTRTRDVDFGTYTEEQYFDDLFALTQYRTDPALAEILVRGSLDTARWMAQQGVKLSRGSAGRPTRSTASSSSGAGSRCTSGAAGRRCSKRCTQHRRAARHRDQLRDAGGRAAARGRAGDRRGRRAGRHDRDRRGAVVLACGSFESNPEMRARYLGPGWDLARVRGTRFNMASACAWRSTSARGRTATGRAAIRSPGTSTRRPMAT